MHEEVDEFLAADGLVDQVDAIIDLLYFALGTMVEQGMEVDPYFALVHQANMAKLTADGEALRREDSKVVKPVGWISPEQRMHGYLFEKLTGVKWPSATGPDYLSATRALAAELLGVRSAPYEGTPAPGVTSLDAKRIWPRGVEDRPLEFSVLDDAQFGVELQKHQLPHGLTAVDFTPDVLYGADYPAAVHLGLVLEMHREDAILVDLHPETKGVHWIRVNTLFAAFKASQGELHRLAPTSAQIGPS